MIDYDRLSERLDSVMHLMQKVLGTYSRKKKKETKENEREKKEQFNRDTRLILFSFFFLFVSVFC